MTELSRVQIIQLITSIVDKYRCEIRKLDVDNFVLDIEGPPEAKMACAQELETFLNF
ncbi:hypothetical protein DENIS_4503 [Desulfonema ishimotonii]|uniref:Uncharacterized protein n=1 Tax=Desulfonema ishimotonii TaxID=45657 RepID=A0A401G2N3_9BACT|nr:hypothetical protein [Desulfonema ishimotonii]GBC63509.1 hypothetical protein DENIS_4503 [Desulfonema ishimotonii]